MSGVVSTMFHRKYPTFTFRTFKVLMFAAVLAALFVSRVATASIVGVFEERSWSDMVITGISGDFTNRILTLNGTGSNDLEIGWEFGPNNPGRHYGSSGTLGLIYNASMSLTGVGVDASGQVTSGGSFVVTFNGSMPGSIGTDYAIAPGASLLTGTVTQVALNATGNDTLDIVLAITGGALQQPNPSLGTYFAPGGIGMLRLANATLPDNWSQDSFSIAANGQSMTVNAFGIVPEPCFTTFAMFGIILGWVGSSRSCFRSNE